MGGGRISRPLGLLPSSPQPSHLLLEGRLPGAWLTPLLHPPPPPRSLQLGSAALPWGSLGQTERGVGRLRSMHSKMLTDIEKVQIHFGGSVKASSQMIRELLHSQCLSCPCYRRWAAGPGPQGRR